MSISRPSVPPPDRRGAGEPARRRPALDPPARPAGASARSAGVRDRTPPAQLEPPLTAAARRSAPPCAAERVRRSAPLGPPPRDRARPGDRPVEVKPPATLACPIVSALDRWIADAVQPAAQKWFGQPVAEIKQISAYSCRGMNGSRRARSPSTPSAMRSTSPPSCSPTATAITVKDGWRGSPEEQGFLRDVQARGLRPVHHRAGARLQRLPLRPHPCRPDAARERPAHLPAGGDGGRGRGSGARAAAMAAGRMRR